jgi:FKBP-type peptidyl-prolyl cis-trans isomerase
MITMDRFIRRGAAMAALLAGAMLPACGGASSNVDTSKPMPDSGITSLQVADPTPGSGPEARPGMTVSVHYTGWLYDAAAPDKKGRKFDSSRDHNQPFEFPLGAGHVVEGWDRGVAGMKVGGSRVLTIPPSMAYGAGGAPDAGIPPNATLIFEVELLNVR